MKSQTATYEVRLGRGEHESALGVVADYLSWCERCLHARLGAIDREAGEGDWSKKDIAKAENALKRGFLSEFGVTGRQYNALLRSLKGRYRSLQALAKLRVDAARDRIGRLETKIRKRKIEIRKGNKARLDIEMRALSGEAPTKAMAKAVRSPGQCEKMRFANHNQMRRIGILQHRIARDEQIAAARVPAIVFGSRKRLRKRSAIDENDAAQRAKWRREWDEARRSQFLVIGSKDETAGCQTCVMQRADDGSLRLSLRVPDALKDSLGTHVLVPIASLPENGREAIHAALDAHIDKAGHRTSIAYRFIRDPDWHPRKRLSQWRVMISVDREVPVVERPVFRTPYEGRHELMAKGTTGIFAGALGVDLNADHLAFGAIDRFGNPIVGRTGRIDLPLRGKTSAQRDAIIGDAVAHLVQLAQEWGLPIVIERLDFSEKKRDLKAERKIACRRMLSALAYGQIQTMLRRRAERAGVELVEVNPAYTSTIGRVNYARRYGLSVHCAAAIAIARRAAELSERVNYVYGLRGRRNALPVPAEARKHVWRQWFWVRRDLIRRAADSHRHTAGAMFSTRSNKDRDEMPVRRGRCMADQSA